MKSNLIDIPTMDSDRNVGALRPERRLMMSVLLTGLTEALNLGRWFAYQSQNEKRFWVRKAQFWVRSDKIYCNEVLGMSFCFLCEALNLDHERIRRAVYSNDPKLREYLLRRVDCSLPMKKAA